MFVADIWKKKQKSICSRKFFPIYEIFLNLIG